MLENLFKLVAENADESIVNNPAIPNEKNNEAIEFATQGIFEGLKNQVSKGNVSDLLKMFSGQQGSGASNSLIENISGPIIKTLMAKFGLDSGSAGSIVQNLIPGVLNRLVSKTNDPNDSSFDINGIFNSLTGGKTSGTDIAGLLDKFKQGGGGDGLDLGDITQMIGGNNKAGGNDLISNISKLFGK